MSFSSVPKTSVKNNYIQTIGPNPLYTWITNKVYDERKRVPVNLY